MVVLLLQQALLMNQQLYKHLQVQEASTATVELLPLLFLQQAELLLTPAQEHSPYLQVTTLSP
ncbi:MAG: hypothetical protein POELPBGB_00875 [Bacteroidia bacterium]|nr:hypothetical protein [Bacteroidia bacterium]